MRITWFGHACFLIDTGKTLILTDPFDSSVGYRVPDVTVDLITESHQHFDHNAHRLIKGKFEIIKDSGDYEFRDVKISGIETFHDDESGARRGRNIVFVFDFDRFRVAHLGDLGHIPDESQIKHLKDLDVLLLPVGGTFTIGPKEARKILDLIKPKIAIPMHYKTKYIKFDIAPVEEFTRLCENVRCTSDNFIDLSEELKSFDRMVQVLNV
ncbi:MBL fold metallo-hydrolase [Pseudothermotoga elfii]